jgi:hypothetical protein
MQTQTFVFILTDANGKKRFGTCRRFLAFGEKLPCSVVLLTRERPEQVLLNQLLAIVENKIAFGSLSAALPLLNEAVSIPMSAMGSEVRVAVSPVEQ